MATVIDALMITLGLDAKAMKKENKAVQADLEKTATVTKKVQTGLDQTAKVAKKPAAELEAMGKKGGEALDKVRNGALRAAAAFMSLSVIKAFVEDVTRSDIALGKMAANANTSVGEMSSLKVAADAAGSSGDSLARRTRAGWPNRAAASRTVIWPV